MIMPQIANNKIIINWPGINCWAINAGTIYRLYLEHEHINKAKYNETITVILRLYWGSWGDSPVKWLLDQQQLSPERCCTCSTV